MSATDTIERALELAADGKHRSIGDIKKTLNREMYEQVEQHLAGSSIQAQLKRLIVKAAGEE